MKIYSSRKDDLIAERDAYDAETSQLDNRTRDEEFQWHLAEKNVEDGIANKVRSIIGRTSLPIDVYAHPAWHNGYEVTVQANEHVKGQPNTSLAWDWRVRLDDEGNIEKESGSWSGLQATTKEQIDDLKESVRVLEILNNTDWVDIVSTKSPSYNDYVDLDTREAYRQRKQQRPDYEKLIIDEELAEAIETGNWIALEGRPETQYRRGTSRGDYAAKVINQTDKFVTVIIKSVSYLKEGGQVAEYDEERISKAKFVDHIKKPVTVLEF